MKNFLVIILPSAESDIGEAYGWLAERDEEAAIRWYNQLLEVIFSLDIFPERCPLAPENKSFRAEIREIFHGRRRHKYRILFTMSENEVHVLHVRPGARRALGASQFIATLLISTRFQPGVGENQVIGAVATAWTAQWSGKETLETVSTLMTLNTRLKPGANEKRNLFLARN